MAGNIKGITIEFRGDTTQLDKALRSIDKETSTIDSELKKVNNGLKFNPTSVELWKQKQTLLTQKVKETSERLNVLKNAQKEMDAKGVDKNSKEYRNLQREIITTESKLKNFKGQLQAVGNVKLRVASEQLKQIGSKATAAGNAMRGISRAAGVVAAGIGALAVKSAKWADDLNTMSKQYRLSTKQLQLYSAAANLVDVDVNTIAKSHVKLTKSMKAASDGSKNQADAFKALGIDVTDANGDLRDSDEVWQETIKALGSMENETERDALAMRIMGGAARELNPLIEDGGETYKNVADTVKKYNLDFIDQKTLDNANAFNDKLDTIKAVGLLAFQSIGAKLAEVLAPALEKVVEAVGKFAGWLGNLNPVILAVIGGIAGLVALIAPALLLFGALATAAGAVTGALAGISAPIIAIVAVIGALVAALVAAYAKSETFRKVVNSIAATVGSLLKSAFASAAKAVQSLIKDLSKTVTVVANQLAPVLKLLMPVFKLIATFLVGRLKNAFNLVVGVIRVFLAIVRSVATIFSTVFRTVVSVASGAVSRIKGVFKSVKDALTKPFETAKNTIKRIIDAIKGFFGFKVSPPNIPLPHFAISPAGWKIGDLLKGKIPSLSIKWYAKGGIFNSPTLAGIGEAGPEAVVPLDKFWRKLEEMEGGNVNINVYPPAGASNEEIAELVMQKIIQLQNRRRVAWQ